MLTVSSLMGIITVGWECGAQAAGLYRGEMQCDGYSQVSTWLGHGPVGSVSLEKPDKYMQTSE